MPKGIASIDEKEKEINILKRGIGELERRMERLEKEVTSVQNASEKLSSHMKALHESAVALIKKVHEFE
jgi:prefoldin subunit 5